MIISDLYQTKIEILKDGTVDSYYNVNIDATDVIVKVTLLDFNNQVVKNKNAKVYVDKGYFKSYKSDDTTTNIEGENTKVYNGTTGDDGSFTLKYAANEWGFCNFRCNENNINIYVNGFKQVYSRNDEFIMYLNVNEATREAEMYFQHVTSTTSSGNNGGVGNNKTLMIAALPDDKVKYLPKSGAIRVNSYRGDFIVILTKDNKIQCRSETALSGKTAYALFKYRF